MNIRVFSVAVLAVGLGGCAQNVVSPRGTLVELANANPKGPCTPMEALSVEVPCDRGSSSCLDKARTRLRNKAGDMGWNHVRTLEPEALAKGTRLQGYGYRCTDRPNPWSLPKNSQAVAWAKRKDDLQTCQLLETIELPSSISRYTHKPSDVLEEEVFKRGANAMFVPKASPHKIGMRGDAYFCDHTQAISDIPPGKIDYMPKRPLVGSVQVSVGVADGVATPKPLASHLKAAIENSLSVAGAAVSGDSAHKVELAVRRYGIQAALSEARQAYLWHACVAFDTRIVHKGKTRVESIERCAPKPAYMIPDRSAMSEAYNVAFASLMEHTTNVLSGIPEPVKSQTVAVRALQGAPRARIPLSVAKKASALVLPLQAKAEVRKDVAELVTNFLLVNLDEVQGLSTISLADIEATIQAERQRDILACDSTSCLAEIGGAFGADLLIYGEVGRLGSSLAVNVSLIDSHTSQVAARTSKQVDREELLRGAAQDVVVDLISKLNRN